MTDSWLWKEIVTKLLLSFLFERFGKKTAHIRPVQLVPVSSSFQLAALLSCLHESLPSLSMFPLETAAFLAILNVFGFLKQSMKQRQKDKNLCSSVNIRIIGGWHSWQQLHCWQGCVGRSCLSDLKTHNSEAANVFLPCAIQVWVCQLLWQRDPHINTIIEFGQIGWIHMPPASGDGMLSLVASLLFD